MIEINGNICLVTNNIIWRRSYVVQVFIQELFKIEKKLEKD